MFQWLTNAQWTSLKIFAGSVAFALFWFRVFTGPDAELVKQKVPVDPRGKITFWTNTGSAVLQSSAEKLAES